MFVRWDNLTLDGEQQAQLPGYRDPANVRRFDAPEALDTRFYEVHAKSALNRVPEKSRMPFRWTVNPYRGCSHACTYCIAGDSQVLLADGRTAAMRDIKVGDVVAGTVHEGAYRRFVPTTVLDKWSSIKPAFEVTLEDGTELVASGDHRFLTTRGWKHVSDLQGPSQRPHLTLSSKLMGPGGCVAPPTVDDDYRRGYLSGVIRGYWHLDEYEHPQPNGAVRRFRCFRLAVADREALARSRRYLADLRVQTREREFAVATGSHRETGSIETHTGEGQERIAELIAWPVLPSLSWVTGFLAGIFDAEGACSGGVLRISNQDEETLRRVGACLGRLRFDHQVERAPGRATTIRVRAGLPERMRFFLGTDPAITRKRTIGGTAVENSARLGVVSIRSLGMVMRLYDITTGTEDFIANGVISHNCFARPTHTYLGFDAGRDFEREIVVKVNAPEVLRAELARPRWKREHVALGTNTDPYQWVEGRYRLMEGIWEALRDAANPCSVLTKSPLLLRDLALMLQIAQRTTFTACLSIPTLDEKAWRSSEPRSPNPRARLEAVAELNRAGIPTGVLIAPLMPGINDAPHQVEPLLEAAQEAGATSIGGVALHLRGEVRGVFMSWLEHARPDLVPRYTELYRRGANAPPEERRRLARMVRKGNAIGSAPPRSALRTHGHAPEEPEADAQQRPRRAGLQASLF
jgi:DNA repair photolyase